MSLFSSLACAVLFSWLVYLRDLHSFPTRRSSDLQNVGYSNFSQPQSHLSFCVLLQYLVERRRVVTQLEAERKKRDEIEAEIGRAVQQECRDRSRMPSSA